MLIMNNLRKKISTVYNKFNDDLTLLGVIIIGMLSFSIYNGIYSDYIWFSALLPLNFILLIGLWIHGGMMNELFESFERKHIKISHKGFRIQTFLFFSLCSTSVFIQEVIPKENNHIVEITQLILFMIILYLITSLAKKSFFWKSTIERTNKFREEIKMTHNVKDYDSILTQISFLRGRKLEVTDQLKSYEATFKRNYIVDIDLHKIYKNFSIATINGIEVPYEYLFRYCKANNKKISEINDEILEEIKNN